MFLHCVVVELWPWQMNIDFRPWQAAIDEIGAFICRVGSSCGNNKIVFSKARFMQSNC